MEKPERTTEELEKAVMKLWEQTFIAHPSYQAIAIKVGCSKQTVWRIIHKYTDKIN